VTDLRESVRERYAEAAKAVSEDACCGDGCCAVGEQDAGNSGSELYGDATRDVPERAVTASLGCGNPTAVAQLDAGDVVLDLGAGGGIDVFLAANRVGPAGRVIGLDMTDEMLELARRNQQEAGVANVEFVKGLIEDIPLDDGTIDVIISNCVINLSVDKPSVFNEMARVLRPGGRVGVSDIVADNELSHEERADRGSHVGCIAGALSFDEYRLGLEGAGFEAVEIVPTHEVVDGMQSAIVRAVKRIS